MTPHFWNKSYDKKFQVSHLAGVLNKTYGHSLIISPWGDIISEAEDNDDMVIAECDVDEVELIRKKIPSINQNYDYL